MTTTAIRPGELVSVFNVLAKRYEPLMVLSACAHRGVGYFCESHDAGFPNLSGLVIHLTEDAPDEDHRVAVWCPECRLYLAADPEQIAALDGHPQPNGA